jgi:hypothetical protein
MMDVMDNPLNVSMPGPASQSTRLPLLVEVSLTATQILVLVVAALTAILSILARADVITIFVRTAAAILGIGIPALFLNWMLGKYFLQATVEDWKNSIPQKNKSDEIQNVSENLETEA